MSDTCGAIHFVCTVLKEAMKVNACALIAELIVNIGNDLVTLGEIEHWQRPLSIDTNGRTLLLSVWIGRDPGDVPVVGHGRRICHESS